MKHSELSINSTDYVKELYDVKVIKSGYKFNTNRYIKEAKKFTEFKIIKICVCYIWNLSHGTTGSDTWGMEGDQVTKI